MQAASAPQARLQLLFKEHNADRVNYHRELGQAFGSPAAALVVQRLLWAIAHSSLYLAVCKAESPPADVKGLSLREVKLFRGHTPGTSWQEELSISPKSFRTLRKQLMTPLKSRQQKLSDVSVPEVPPLESGVVEHFTARAKGCLFYWQNRRNHTCIFRMHETRTEQMMLDAFARCHWKTLYYDVPPDSSSSGLPELKPGYGWWDGDLDRLEQEVLEVVLQREDQVYLYEELLHKMFLHVLDEIHQYWRSGLFGSETSNGSVLYGQVREYLFNRYKGTKQLKDMLSYDIDWVLVQETFNLKELRTSWLQDPKGQKKQINAWRNVRRLLEQKGVSFCDYLYSLRTKWSDVVGAVRPSHKLVLSTRLVVKTLGS